MANKNLPAIPTEIKVYIPTTALKSLSGDEIRAIEAGAGMVIKDYWIPSLIQRVEQIVWDAFVIRGHGIKDDKYYDTTAEFSKELQKSFSVFTIEQISEAIRMGALGKLEHHEDENKIRHISAHGLCIWVWLWNDKVKKEAVHKRNKAIDAEEKAVDEEKKAEFQKIFLRDIQECYDHWILTGQLLGESEEYHAVMYEFFEKELGPLKIETKNAIFSKASKEVDSETPSDETLRLKRFYKNDYEELQTKRKKIRSKRYALEYVFQFLKEQKTDKIFKEK